MSSAPGSGEGITAQPPWVGPQVNDWDPSSWKMGGNHSSRFTGGDESSITGGHHNSGRVLLWEGTTFQVQGMELLLQLTEGEHNSASLEGTTVSANKRGTLLQVYGKGPQLQVHRMG